VNRQPEPDTANCPNSLAERTAIVGGQAMLTAVAVGAQELNITA